MKIAVSSSADDINAVVDSRFGRAPFFIIADTESGEWSALANTQNVQAAQGAGIQSAEHVVNSGAEAVLSGHCGPKAFRALTAGNVKIYVCVDGLVSEAIERFKKGELTATDAADVEGHWV